MLRRELFTSLAAISAMVGAGRMAFRSSAASAVEHESISSRPTSISAIVERRVSLQTCALAGFQYHQGEKLWPHLAPAASLRLVREPANPYDTLAIRVEWQVTPREWLKRLGWQEDGEHPDLRVKSGYATEQMSFSEFPQVRHFLPKPYRAEQLIRKVSEILGATRNAQG